MTVRPRSLTDPAALLLGGLLALASCSERGEEGHRFQTLTQEGVPVAVTNLVPRYEEPLFWYEEMVRLEQDESRPETLLYQAYDYIMGDDGRYYVSDRGNGRVAVFDPDGRFLFGFGREGEGPGEFRYPGLLSVEEGVVTLYDSGNRRVSTL